MHMVISSMLLTVKGYGATSMSDYHEMYENWIEGGYDPAYIGEDRERKDENNEPIDPDDWADNAFDGG